MTDDAVPSRHFAGFARVETFAAVGFEVIDEAVHNGDQVHDAAVEFAGAVVLECALDLTASGSQSLMCVEPLGAPREELVSSVELDQPFLGAVGNRGLSEQPLDFVYGQGIMEDPVASPEPLVEPVDQGDQPVQLPLGVEELPPQMAGEEPCQELGTLCQLGHFPEGREVTRRPIRHRFSLEG